MTEIRIHGRGGQGVVTAAELIAMAAFCDGKISQAFPYFGVERTGAPIEAFARIDNRPIKLREQINNPDILIILDPTLIGNEAIKRGAGKKTLAIINSAKNKEEVSIGAPAKNTFVVDATKIAMEKIGRNIVNTTILGAFAKATGLVSLESLKKAVKEKFKDKGESVVNKNIGAIEEAYNS